MKGMLVFSSRVLLPSEGLASASNGSVTLDSNHIGLLADTHISENPQQFVYGTRWPGSSYQDDEHETYGHGCQPAGEVRQRQTLGARETA
jgi:hypothetical protein